jgi:hypothetical protein
VPSVPGLTPDYGVIGQPIADLGTWAMGAGQLVGGAGLIVVALVLVALLTLGASKTVGKLAG